MNILATKKELGPITRDLLTWVGGGRGGGEVRRRKFKIWFAL